MRGSRGTSWRTAGLAAAAAAALVVLVQRDRPPRMELAADSTAYHFLGANMALGRGYYDGPIGSLDDYGPRTRVQFPGLEPIAAKDQHLPSRTPGYPLLLALIYRAHGIDPDVVPPYHLLLVAVTAIAMVFTAELLWGDVGALAGLAAVLALGHGRELHYSVYQLLTEDLATCVVAMVFLAVAWAKQKSPSFEAVPGVVAAVGLMVRPALIFVPIAYALCLLLDRREIKKRSVAFLSPVLIVTSVWCGYVSDRAGRFVLLSDTGKGTFIAGTDPAVAAFDLGQHPPAIDRRSLEEFWTRYPGGPSAARGMVATVAVRLPSRWREYAKITFIKLQVGVERLPDAMWIATLLGVALSASVALSPDSLPRLKVASVVIVAPGGWCRNRRIVLGALAGAAGGLVLCTLGFSHPLLKGLFWVAPSIFPLGRMRLGGDARPVWSHWLLFWYMAYLMTIVTTFAIPRFTRPFLPAFYLLAAMAIPMLAVTIAAITGSRIAATDYKLAEDWR